MLLNATDRKHLFISLDAAFLRCCLFPAHFIHFTTSIETRLRLRQRCLLRCVSSFTYGNIQRLEQLHLRSDKLFSVGRYLAPLPFLSGLLLVTLRFFVHLRIHSEA